MTPQSSFRSLVETTNKLIREELDDYYIVNTSRMNNLLWCLETGATQIQQLTEHNLELRKALKRIAEFYEDAESDFSDDAPTGIAKEALRLYYNKGI